MAGVAEGPRRRGSGRGEPAEMVFEVEFAAGPGADLMARAQVDIIEEICGWAARRRAADARADAANDAPGPADPE